MRVHDIMIMRRANVALALMVALFAASPALAWGGKGHRISAEVAQALLTPGTKAAALELLGAESLAVVSSLPDQWRIERRETRMWHFVDIPMEADRYDAVRDCPDDNCVVAALDRYLRQLREKDRPAAERREALIWVIHLITDAHQPMHCANAGDAAGNLTKVHFHGAVVNLHSVWDARLFEDDVDDRQYARRLLERRNLPLPSQGTPVTWVNESHALAQKFVYDFDREVLGSSYEKRSRAVVEEQILRAGRRIAAEIETALGNHPES